MSAHRDQRLCITPELVTWLAHYHQRHPAWGVLHVVFDDGNWGVSVSDLAGDDEEAMLAAIVDDLTPSQKRRACGAASSVANHLRTLPESLGEEWGGGSAYLDGMEWSEVAGMDVTADLDGFTV